MESPRGLFQRIAAATRTLAAKLRPRQPGMIGVPPSARPMWYDPAAHARDFAGRYGHDLDLAVAERMTELGIKEIGFPDRNAGIQWAAFHPHGELGGSYAPDGRLIVDSGVLNLGLLDKNYDENASELFRRSRLRDRLDSIIAHEFEEHRNGMSHEAALKAAPKTALPISDTARAICRAMEKGWLRR